MLEIIIIAGLVLIPMILIIIIFLIRRKNKEGAAELLHNSSPIESEIPPEYENKSIVVSKEEQKIKRVFNFIEKGLTNLGDELGETVKGINVFIKSISKVQKDLKEVTVGEEVQTVSSASKKIVGTADTVKTVAASTLFSLLSGSGEDHTTNTPVIATAPPTFSGPSQPAKSGSPKVAGPPKGSGIPKTGSPQKGKLPPSPKLPPSGSSHVKKPSSPPGAGAPKPHREVAYVGAQPQAGGGLGSLRDEMLTELDRLKGIMRGKDKKALKILDTLDDKLRKDHKVYFSVYSPTSISGSNDFILHVWAYLIEQQSDMDIVASRKGTYKESVQKGPIPAKEGDIFQLRLVLPQPFKVINENDTIIWWGEITNATFPVSVPEHISFGTHLGQVQIFKNGIQLLRIDFTIEVGENISQVIDTTQKLTRITKAFASYSRKDQQEVLQAIQGIRALGIEVFLDNLSIKQGDYWEKEIYQNILSSEVFLLFWSKAAKNSEWVEKEWTFALDNRGIDFIQPIPLEDPEIAPPPERLASKHFHDLIRIYLNSLSVPYSSL